MVWLLLLLVVLVVGLLVDRVGGGAEIFGVRKSENEKMGCQNLPSV